MFKKIFTILAAVLIICSTAYCFDLLDTGAAVSLEIKYKYDNNDISGAKFDLYKVADVSKFVDYTPTEQFSKYEVSYDMRADGGRSLAQTLAAYAAADSLSPLKSGATDENGALMFPDLKTGLYLVTGASYETGGYIYSAEPFLVCLPNYENDKWVNDVVAVPKISRTMVPSSGGGGGGHVPDPRMDLGVLIVWKNDTEETRPDSVEVELYKGNSLYNRQTVGKNDGWHHTWYNLPYGGGIQNTAARNSFSYSLSDLTYGAGSPYDMGNANVIGTAGGNVYYNIRTVADAAEEWRATWGDVPEYYDYYVVEKKVPENYTVGITREDNVFIITHTLKKEEAAPEPTTEAPTETTTKVSSETPTEEPSEQSPVIAEPVVPENTEDTTYDPLTDIYGRGGRNTSGTTGPDRPGRDDENEPNVPGLPGYTGGTGSRTGASGSGNGLPQTGQLKWPVPIMATSGLLLFLLGFIRHKEQEIKLSESENQ